MTQDIGGVLDLIDSKIELLIKKRNVHTNVVMILSLQSQIDILLELKEEIK